MSIPKVIHYCWFGRKEKTKEIKRYLDTWSKLEGYEVIEWNESNFDINVNEYVKKAYKDKKYAFVSDYVRLKVLYEYGGLYLDTDVEINKRFDELLESSMFLGFMYDSLLGTAVIGAEKGNKVIKDLLDKYEVLEYKVEANNNIFTEYFLNNFSEFRLNNKYQQLNGNISIYPKEYFERPTINKKYDFSNHHYTATWKENNNKNFLKSIVKFILPNIIYRSITHKRALKYTPFYDVYLEHNR